MSRAPRPVSRAPRPASRALSCLAMTALHFPFFRLVPASSGVALPPLECLFTVQEEVGLRGAFDLDVSMIKGRTMLNLVSHFPATLIPCPEKRS